MEPGRVSKFYVVSFLCRCAVEKGVYKVDQLDRISPTRAIEVAHFNGKTEVKKVKPIRIGCKK